MRVINIATYIPNRNIPDGVGVRLAADDDLIAVGDSEPFTVMRINETDSALCLPDMTVEPILAIAVAIEVVFSLMRIQSHEIGMISGIDSHAEVSAGFIRQRIFTVKAEPRQRIPVRKVFSILSERMEQF